MLVGSFGVVGTVICSVVGIEWLENRVRVTELLLVLPTAANFFFMMTEMAVVDTTSCISEIVEMHPDVLVDLLVVLARVFDAVAPSSPWRGCLSSWC